jgi:hypothetical protein
LRHLLGQHAAALRLPLLLINKRLLVWPRLILFPFRGDLERLRAAGQNASRKRGLLGGRDETT